MVLASATTVDEALWLQAHRGRRHHCPGPGSGRAPGHVFDRGPCHTKQHLALAAQVIAAVRVPVIAAGGIGDAQGVATALGLGACAVQVGTRVLPCDEATTSAVHRSALQKRCRPQHGLDQCVHRQTGARHRQPHGARTWADQPLAPAFPTAAAASLPLRQVAERHGSGDFRPCGRPARVGLRGDPGGPDDAALGGLGRRLGYADYALFQALRDSRRPSGCSANRPCSRGCTGSLAPRASRRSVRR